MQTSLGWHRHQHAPANGALSRLGTLVRVREGGSVCVRAGFQLLAQPAGTLGRGQMNTAVTAPRGQGQPGGGLRLLDAGLPGGTPRNFSQGDTAWSWPSWKAQWSSLPSLQSGSVALPWLGRPRRGRLCAGCCAWRSRRAPPRGHRGGISLRVAAATCHGHPKSQSQGPRSQ